MLNFVVNNPGWCDLFSQFGDRSGTGNSLRERHWLTAVGLLMSRDAAALLAGGSHE
jgi:hypothetical protein